MVLSGKVNKTIVQAINGQGGKAVGLSGKDADLLLCKQADGGLGMVGDPVTVNADVVHSLLENGYVPVIAPLGAGTKRRNIQRQRRHRRRRNRRAVYRRIVCCC